MRREGGARDLREPKTRVFRVVFLRLETRCFELLEPPPRAQNLQSREWLVARSKISTELYVYFENGGLLMLVIVASDEH